jgi:hypothetical protein
LRQTLLTPLGSLSHADLGPVDLIDAQRQHRKRLGYDVDSTGEQDLLVHYADMTRRKRVDVVSNALRRRSSAFDEPALRLFLAENIVAIDRAAPGRWRLIMTILADWYQKPELGYLIVLAGIALLDSRAVTGREMREWIDASRGWRDPAWIMPLESAAGG